MIPRKIETVIREYEKGYPVIAITGPRQSGKTTLAKNLFPDKPYRSFETPSTLEWANDDPVDFLNHHIHGAVFDEIQRCPKLFSYLQEIVDQEPRYGRFIVTGSQQFGLMSSITQSLAGRVALVELLPFAYDELFRGKQDLDALLLKGFYPPIYDRHLAPFNWFANYVTTYVERDVRNLINVKDISTFQKFLKLCAGRCGQLLNLSQLAADAGMTHNTAKSWISILEASYIVFQLQPYYKNFSKRLIKTPKLYFWDVGLASYLLGLQSPEHLRPHPLRGSLFENLIVSELLKMRYNQGLKSNLYFWRDRSGNEVDLLAETAPGLLALEIKSGKTVNADFFKGIKYLKKIIPENMASTIIYGGEQNMRQQDIRIIGWQHLSEIAI